MIQLPNRPVWLGNAADLRDMPGLLQTPVTAIVDLAVEEPIPRMPRVINYSRFALTDEGEEAESIIAAALRLVSSSVADQVRVAVCCNAGLNRSPTIAAVGMALALKSEARAELRAIASLKAVDVNPALWSRVVGVSETLTR